MNRSELHFFIMRHTVDRGFAPRIADIARHFHVSPEQVVSGLRALQEYHGVWLHPNTAEVWVMHPFANAPTNFWITSARGSWWANCAWCALGVAALVDDDVCITTTLGAESRQVVVEIAGGEVSRPDLLVHFPVPMAQAWDNVIYTCSTLLFFDSKEGVRDWCARHGMSVGDIQPIRKIWNLSKIWYGRHLDPDWTKWSAGEAQEIFDRFDLGGPVWDLPRSDERF